MTESTAKTASNRLQTVSDHLSAPEKAVLFRTEGSAGIFQLNRPKKLNVINHEIVDLLTDQLRQWRQDPSIKIIVGTGDSRAFCAGGDVVSLVNGIKTNDPSVLPFFKSQFEMDWLAANMGKPYVAIMHVGGGGGLSLPAPIRICTPSTVFAMPETKIGFAPDVGALYYLAQLDGEIGAWLALTGQEIYGRSAYELGIATHYVQPENIPKLIQTIGALPTPSEEAIANLIPEPPAPRTTLPSSKSNPDGSSSLTPSIIAFLNKTFALPSVPSILKSLDEAARDQLLDQKVREWAKEQRRVLSTRCPSGIAISLEAYKLAKQRKRLDEVLENDMTIVTAHSSPHRLSNNLIYGVTSLLIDRAGAPRWDPPSSDDPALEPRLIRQKFIQDREMRYRPRLVFFPPVVEDEEGLRWGRFRRHWSRAR